ncbi:hypothetical protein SAY87_027916 [Trapa incisa]|uniref:Uncharacterized protein n=1 Tax=Trapa incisa TaxID=236973 RepID=A0AAN7L1M3_9MYRT|nr:hypothetical protein SAY87_027916 [Trapa incisa]
MESAQQNSDKPTNVQRVNRKCSDELLRKFSDEGDGNETELASAPKRRKKSSRSRVGPAGAAGEFCDSPTHGHGSGGSLVERRSLLPASTRRRSVLLRQLGIGRSAQLRARDMRNRSLLGAIEKAWRKTVEGASRVFVEKQYNRHKRLISDSAYGY